MPTNGAVLSLGTNEVVLTVADSAGHQVYSTNTVVVVDTTAPVLTLSGANPLTVECHGAFTDPGASASDDCSGVVEVTTNGIVNVAVPGSYTIEYSATDAAGNSVTNTRIVNVVDTLGPVIALQGTNPEVVECHSTFSDPGATATDACVGAVGVGVSGGVNADIPGSYTLTYTADDGNGNTNSVTRIVNVVDRIGPVIALLGANPATNECHVAYTDAGATASDACAGSVGVLANNTVDANVPGVYTVTYASGDGNGNTNIATRTVYIVDTTAPVLTVLGANPATNECHVPYVDSGATASDACAGFRSVSTNIAVDVNIPGVYTVVYASDDGNGNTNTVTRTIYVTDTTPPVITLLGANPATNECHVLYSEAGAIASDACAGSVGVSTNSTVDANVPGVYSVTYTSDDGNGNTNIVTRTVYVVDTLPPVIAQCPTNRTMVVGDNCLVTLPDFTGELMASDACGAVTVSQNPAPGTEVGVGALLITFTATDEASNSSLCSMVLNVTTPASANTNISITEFMAKNTMTTTDDFGAYSDWIEIHNAGSCPVNLDGWSLTDDVTSLTKWRFPATNIGPGQFLIVWASDQNLRTPGAPLHTNFKLADEGEYLALVQPDGVTIATQFYPTFPTQLPDISYGLPADSVTNNYLAWPTPGAANSPGTNIIADFRISEFMAKNTLGITDDFGAHSDWIEVYNAGCCPANLNGWFLTDDATLLTKWRFPATNLAAGQFLVVWASDKNRRNPGAPLHTNFKLADEGEYLALVRPDGVTIATQFSPTFPPQLPDVSFGLPPDSAANNYLASPTPGSVNGPATNFIVANLEFNPARGWFTNSVSVSIASPTPGVTIYFTTNGTLPNPTNGFVYNSPLIFSNTTVLRAAGYRAAYLPSAVTHTYVFPKQVVNQTGAGFPTTWGVSYAGTVPAYYSCNSNLAGNSQWSSQMPRALLSLPTLSVVMNPDDIFSANGIYSNPFEDGVEWERPCSIEYFRPDGAPGFQINCGIRIQGEASRDPAFMPKHSLRLLFKQIYGSGKLLFALYPDSPVREFDALALHASFDDHWLGALGTGATAQMQRNQWFADTQRESSGLGTHGFYVNLYLNGLYWGMYNLGERPDASFAARYLGGKQSDYDAFSGDQLLDGTATARDELLAIAHAGITNEIAWSNICHYLNVPTFIDYLMINWYGINHDWLVVHNFGMLGNVTHGVPFHFVTLDAETSLGVWGGIPLDYPIISMTEASWGPSGVLYSSLQQYPEFRRLFGDHAQRLLFNHGALTPERSANRWMKRAREIDPAIIAESVRWGITNWWASEWSGWDSRVNTHDDWLAEQTYLMTNWFPRRTDILIGQLREVGLYPAMDAPTFAPHGGIIVDSLPVTITTPSATVLYYTTNGSDPRLPDGSASPEALVYDQGTMLTLTLTNNLHLSARAFATNAWSALVEADYTTQSQVDLRIGNITRQRDGAIKLDFLAWPGASYTLGASTNLTDWEAIATVVPFPDGSITFVDTAATNYPVRFYRLTWP
ncbi:MAG: DUF5011 domain-containing protein [Verrucomicrobiota bacterium]